MNTFHDVFTALKTETLSSHFKFANSYYKMRNLLVMMQAQYFAFSVTTSEKGLVNSKLKEE